MRGEYPKGGSDVPGGRAIFLAYSSPGAVFLGISPPFERGANLLGGGIKVLSQRHGQIAVPF
jgi:hypothetical protein